MPEGKISDPLDSLKQVSLQYIITKDVNHCINSLYIIVLTQFFSWLNAQRKQKVIFTGVDRQEKSSFFLTCSDLRSSP